MDTIQLWRQYISEIFFSPPKFRKIISSHSISKLSKIFTWSCKNKAEWLSCAVELAGTLLITSRRREMAAAELFNLHASAFVYANGSDLNESWRWIVDILSFQIGLFQLVRKFCQDTPKLRYSPLIKHTRLLKDFPKPPKLKSKMTCHGRFIPVFLRSCTGVYF